uniref:Penaeidin-3 n=1 Tax=Penaeus indicus TaxID=29960 RepID=PEN3_PENIN|nr:RecName: Full=Penaeidin-3; Short=Fi-Pen3; AltName: Full=Antimicrobial peptide penaeidin 3; Short=AMP penaeidin-3; Flags: Precursor [Penaeus indicus]ADN43391.1 penaeidin 3 [Penaeus indicus]
MRLVVCLVYLVSFALVCQGQGFKGGYTGSYSRAPPYGSRGPISTHPISRPATGCTSCHTITFDKAACCRLFGRCCSALKG